ncbi:response regulator [candidate division KSB1 bacterium]|nr:response regulator [candidate division KSB1 bacterium]
MQEPIMKWTAVIVDDEPLAIEALTGLLGGYPEIEIVGQADSIELAIQVLETHSPDLVFLDIQLPGGTGFDILNKIDYKGQVVFVTAFDSYAIRAFEINALDYLTKPVYPARLQKTIERLNSKPDSPQLKKLKENDILFLLVDDRKRFIRVDSILCIIAAKDYTLIKTSYGINGLVNRSMTDWEQRLPDNLFCRIHRSTIVNLAAIEKTETRGRQSEWVYVRTIRDPFAISRRMGRKLGKLLG